MTKGKTRVNKFLSLSLIIVVVFAFIFVFLRDYVEGFINTDEYAIRKFVKEVLKDEVEVITIDLNARQYDTPLFLGIPHKKYIVNKWGNWFYVTVADGRVYEYSRANPKSVGGSFPPVETEIKLTEEEAWKKIEILYEYLGIMDNKNLGPPIPKITDTDFYIKRETFIDGIACRWRELAVELSRIDGRLTFFWYSTPIKAVNRKPKGPCPEDKVKEIVKEWMKTKKEFYLFKERSPELTEDKGFQLVIAPAYDVYDFGQPGKEKWKDKNFYYAWEVPFIFWDKTRAIPTDWVKHKGVAWIEVEKLEVIGARGMGTEM